MRTRRKRDFPADWPSWPGLGRGQRGPSVNILIDTVASTVSANMAPSLSKANSEQDKLESRPVGPTDGGRVARRWRCCYCCCVDWSTQSVTQSHGRRHHQHLERRRGLSRRRCLGGGAAPVIFISTGISCERRNLFKNVGVWPTLGVADVHLRRLHYIQNATARLVSRVRRSDHITPVLALLHWLTGYQFASELFSGSQCWCGSVYIV